MVNEPAVDGCEVRFNRRSRSSPPRIADRAIVSTNLAQLEAHERPGSYLKLHSRMREGAERLQIQAVTIR